MKTDDAHLKTFQTNIHFLRWRAWLGLCALVLALAAADQARAFNIMLPMVHGPITSNAVLAATGWNLAATDQLVENVLAVDRADSKITCYGFNIQADVPPYLGIHHFDRNPGVSNITAFTNAAAYVRSCLSNAIVAINAGNGTNGRMFAAQGIHALEDLFAHSNWVDLGTNDQTTVTNAVYNGAIMPPATLLLTGYDNAPATPCLKPGASTNDPRPHDSWALDTSNFNANASGVITNGLGATNTRHLFAVAQATISVTDFLRRLTNGINTNNVGTLQTTSAAEVGTDERTYAWAVLQAYNPGGFSAEYVSPTDGTNEVVFPAMSLPQPERAGLLEDTGDALGHDTQNIYTPTGELLTVFREIRPTYQTFNTPLQVHFQYAALDVSNLLAGTLKVFYADPNGESWLPVSSAIVSESQRTADFLATVGGVYAIGGQGVPEIGTIQQFQTNLVQLYLVSSPNQTVSLQINYDLTTTNWTSIFTFTNITGEYDYNDAIVPNPPAKFYRLITP